jgi:F0F1-type ATP synthase assembly protein I
VVGVLIFAPGIILVVTTRQEIGAIVGSLLIVAAALMFMWIYFTHDHRTSPD